MIVSDIAGVPVLPQVGWIWAIEQIASCVWVRDVGLIVGCALFLIGVVRSAGWATYTLSGGQVK